MSSPVGTRVYNKRDGEWEGNSLGRHKRPHSPPHLHRRLFLRKVTWRIESRHDEGLIETLGQKLSGGGGNCTTVKWLNALGRRASGSSHLWPNLHLVFCEPCFELADLQKVSFLLRSAS